jgi:hypothetical protein
VTVKAVEAIEQNGFLDRPEDFPVERDGGIGSVAVRVQ